MRLKEVSYPYSQEKYVKLTIYFLENKEIQLFQQRLDETSGLLSEQKIKSSELEKNLEQCRKDYDMKISTALKEHEKSQNLLKKELSDFKSLFESGICSKLEEFKPLLDAQKSDIDTKIDSLQERYSYLVSLFALRKVY